MTKQLGLSALVKNRIAGCLSLLHASLFVLPVEPAVAASLTSDPSSGLTVTRSFAFLHSIGVNTHLSWWNTAWGVGGGTWAGAESKVLNELSYLKVNNVRDAALQEAYLMEMTDLAKEGCKFDLVQTVSNGKVDLKGDIVSLMALEAAAPGSIVSYEGANEYNTNNYILNGQRSFGKLDWGSVDNQASLAALRGQVALADVIYLAAVTASVPSAPVVSTYVDGSNWHVYGGIGEQLKTNLARAVKAAEATAVGKPVFITETGISSAATSQATWGTAGGTYLQGLIDTNVLLDSYNDGVARTFLYNLMDNNSTARLEDNFGLFKTDGKPKPAAIDIHNLISILADDGPTAATFSVKSISLLVAGLPSTASDMLLEKSNGTIDLVVWNSGAIVWNTATKTEANVTASTITVTLDDRYKLVNLYDPLISSHPFKVFANVRTLSAELLEHPLIIEIAASVR